MSYASEPSKTKNYSLTPFKYILGEKLLHYNVYGFNDYEFRTHFDEFDFNIASIIMRANLQKTDILKMVQDLFSIPIRN